METPGSFIKRERELRGITLDEIADETKIGKTFLNALEKDDYDSLPGATFVKGFLRAYSKYVGLDGNDVVLRYEDFIGRTKEEKGYCSTGKKALVSSFSAHFGEEPQLVGDKGSGTIFFSNWKISVSIHGS